MTEYAAVTTFDKTGYESHGREMVETFDLHWPDETVGFSHKCFAIFDAARRTDADVLLWLDADLRCFTEELLTVRPEPYWADGPPAVAAP